MTPRSRFPKWASVGRLALLASLLIFSLPTFAAQVVFSEVMYRPSGSKPEFIEIWNITATPLDAAKWRFTNGIEYTFPDFSTGSPQAHFIRGNERVILSAANESATRAAYPSIPANVRVFGPWTSGSLSNSGERVTLEDKNGVILATLSYGIDGLWPVAPNGTGHSLVLADENTAQDDWRVWRHSTNNGGSPGAADPAPPAVSLSLNEVHFRAMDGNVDWVELRNNSPSVSLSASGLFLASTSDFSDKVALSGTLTPGTVASFDVNFAQDDDGFVQVYLIDASNHVRDAVKLRRRAGRDSWQVFPAGSRNWYNDPIPTRDGLNNPERNTSIVINEIMHDPPSNQRDGEYVELYNRGSEPVNVGGWRLAEDVDFGIPKGIVIQPGGYLVVGANPEWLNATYAGLAAVGGWTGNLRNSGDLLRLLDEHGNVADEVDYRSGGEWPLLSGGDGSALELINPDLDNSVGSAWKDSDESAKSTFESYAIDGGIYRKRTYGGVQDDELFLWLVGEGHLIVKNVVLRPTAGGANILPNPSLTTLTRDNTQGWLARGTHWASFHDAEGVHLIADGGGDSKCNMAEIAAVNMAANVQYTLTFDARWAYGTPRLVAQTWDGTWGGTTRIPIPNNLGTPGAVNTRFQAAPPPRITGLNHSPAVPIPSSLVLVTAAVDSVAPLAEVVLHHRLDNVNYNGTWNSTAMADNGLDGDVRAGDGIFTGRVQLSAFGYAASGRLVEFYVRATTAAGESSYLPRGSVVREPHADAPPRTAMWVVDANANPASDLRKVRVVISDYWLDAINTPDVGASPPGSGIPTSGGGSAKFNFKFPRLQSHYFPCTYIHDDSVVYYGCTVNKTGSPFTRGTGNTLDRARLKLPGDKLFRGTDRIYWDNDGVGGSMLHNRISRYWLYLLGVPANENEVLRVQRNNSGYNTRESNEVFGKDMLDRIYEDGSDGQFFEIDDWHLIGDDGNVRLDSREIAWDYAPADRPGADNPVSYHNNFVPNSLENEYDFANLIEWNRQLEASGAIAPAERLSRLERTADIHGMSAYAAVRGYTADWDNITMGRAKNGYFYNRSTDRKWMLIHWDSDLAFESSHINDAVIGTEVNVQAFYGHPVVRRYASYFLNQMITTYAGNSPRMTAWYGAEESASSLYNVPSTYISWPTTVNGLTRHQVISNFIGSTTMNATLVVSSPSDGASVTSDSVTAFGTAPIEADSVICVSHPEAVFAWTATSTANLSPWSLTGIRLASGVNNLVFRALDRDGAQVGTDIVRSITKTNDAPPVVTVASTPESQDVALGEILRVDASGSFDPDGQVLTYTWTVTPETGFTVSSPSASVREFVFSTPGVYTVSVQADDGTGSVTVDRVYTVYSDLDGDTFDSTSLAGYTLNNVEMLDNYSPTAWYSLTDEPGNLVLQITEAATLPVRPGAPIYPIVTRPLPANDNFVLQSTFRMDGRQSGLFLAGLSVETLESGQPVRYIFGLDGGLNVSAGTVFRLVRSINGGSYGTLGSTVAYKGGPLTVRVQRIGTSLNFQVRRDGTWLNIFSQTIGVNTVERGGVFASTGNINATSITPGQALRVVFEDLLYVNPATSMNVADSLRITEVMYNSLNSGGLEFVELRNIGAQPIYLNGCNFESGFPFTGQFTFGKVKLSPGQYCVVTNDAALFASVNGPGTLVAGEYSGSLSNNGERILLRDSAGAIIHDFEYGVNAPWPTTPNGQGPSLEVIDTNPALYSSASNWRASAEIGGSPGYLGFGSDSDGDGFADTLETVFGSNPTSGSSIPQVPQTSRDSGTGHVTLVWGSEAGRIYTIEYRNSLDSGKWLPLASKTAVGVSTSYTDTTAGAQMQRLYRIKYELP